MRWGQSQRASGSNWRACRRQAHGTVGEGESKYVGGELSACCMLRVACLMCHVPCCILHVPCCSSRVSRPRHGGEFKTAIADGAAYSGTAGDVTMAQLTPRGAGGFTAQGKQKTPWRGAGAGVGMDMDRGEGPVIVSLDSDMSCCACGREELPCRQGGASPSIHQPCTSRTRTRPRHVTSRHPGAHLHTVIGKLRL